MNLQQVLEKFALIAELSSDEAAVWSSVCQDSIDEITGLLKDGINESDYSGRLTTAAASLAFYTYSLYRASGSGMDSFTAGTVRISSNKKSYVQNAEMVWLNAKARISDLIKDTNFVFEQVEI